MVYFTGCNYQPKDIEDLVKLFGTLPFETIHPVVKQLSSDYSTAEKGEMYYNLIWNTHYREWFNERKLIAADVQEASDGMKDYSKKFINAREDNFELTYLNKFIKMIATNDLSLEDRILELSSKSTKGVNEALKEVLTNTSYSDLEIVLKHLKQLPLSEFEKERFLTEDFGFFIPAFKENDIDEFATNYSRMSERDLYIHYLNKLNVSYKKPDGKLNYEKV